MVVFLALRALVLGPLLAAFGGHVNWFYLVFMLTGISTAIFFTLGLAFILEFGTDSQRPTYFGLANTLTSPVTVIAPMLGGWLADIAGFQSTFLTAAAAGVFTILVLHFFVTDPRRQRTMNAASPGEVSYS